MQKLLEAILRDEAEMRAFYQSFGINPAIIDAAIRLRYSTPNEDAPTEGLKIEKRRKRRRAALR